MVLNIWDNTHHHTENRFLNPLNPRNLLNLQDDDTQKIQNGENKSSRKKKQKKLGRNQRSRAAMARVTTEMDSEMNRIKLDSGHKCIWPHLPKKATVERTVVSPFD